MLRFLKSIGQKLWAFVRLVGRKLYPVVRFLLDYFFYFRCWILNALAYLSIFAYSIENATWPEVKAARYKTDPYEDRDLSKADDLDQILETAQECVKAAGDRRSGLIDKCKTLLTFSSLLLAVATALLPKAFAFNHLWMRIIFFGAALALLNAIVLLLVFFDVRTTSEISLEQDRTDLPSDDLKKSLINAYLSCQRDADAQTDYLVDLYRATRFFLALDQEICRCSYLTC